MTSYRYLCTNTSHPGSAMKRITFQSWDPRILNIPLLLSSQSNLLIPVQFSNDRVHALRMGWARSKISDALRVVCTESHDDLHLQYLHLVEHSAVRSWANEAVFKSFPAIDDTSSDGFHGFVLSAQWLQDM